MFSKCVTETILIDLKILHIHKTSIGHLVSPLFLTPET
jgi:hypothetical protein